MTHRKFENDTKIKSIYVLFYWNQNCIFTNKKYLECQKHRISIICRFALLILSAQLKYFTFCERSGRIR